MAELTTKLELYKPGGGSSGTNLPDEAADIDKLNGNFDIIDAAMGIFECTSVTRPSDPYTGQMITETDTSFSYYWDGGSWNPLSSPVEDLDADVITTGVFDAARIPDLDDLNGTLDIASGGTGATTAAGARTNLGWTSGTPAPSGGSDGDFYFQTQ